VFHPTSQGYRLNDFKGRPSIGAEERDVHLGLSVSFQYQKG
jgi:hypothetical protein